MKRTVAVLIVLAVASSSAQSQTTAPPIQRWFFVDTVTIAKVAVIETVMKPYGVLLHMRATIHDLIVAEEKYWNDHGTYTTDGSALGTYPSKSGDPMAQVIFAGSRGWTGMATDRSLQGKSCVVYIGSEKELPGGVPKTMGGIVATAQGVSACDEP